MKMFPELHFALFGWSRHGQPVAYVLPTLEVVETAKVWAGVMEMAEWYIVDRRNGVVIARKGEPSAVGAE